MSRISIKKYFDFLDSDESKYFDYEDDSLMLDIYKITNNHMVNFQWLTCENDYSLFFKELRKMQNEIQKRAPDSKHEEYLKSMNAVSQGDIEDHEDLLVEKCNILQAGLSGSHEEL